MTGSLFSNTLINTQMRPFKMELQPNMEKEEINEREFTLGFNHASYLSDYAPEILADIVPDNNPSNDYFDGLLSGKHFFEMEKQQSQEEAELQTIRSNSKDLDNELGR
jgi:hypothetical protein